MKLHHGKVRLVIRKRLFAGIVVRNRNRLPRKVIMAPNLLVLKKHLVNALRYTVYLFSCLV